MIAASSGIMNLLAYNAIFVMRLQVFVREYHYQPRRRVNYRHPNNNFDLFRIICSGGFTCCSSINY